MTLETVVIDQGGAGTTQLRAAPSAENTIRVINYTVVLSAAGTVAFSDGTDWLTGDMPLDTNGGISANGDLYNPLFFGGKGRPLSITSTGGSAHGHALIAIY